MIKFQTEAEQQQPGKSFFGKWARRRVLHRLESISTGSITIDEQGVKSHCGSTGPIAATIRVHGDRFFSQLLCGDIAIAESYIQGDWECDDLTSLFRIVLKNQQQLAFRNNFFANLSSLGKRIFHLLRPNTIQGSRRNIAAHYDLGNDFFRLWLDDTMAYSSGIFESEFDSMRQASNEKFDRVCRKLDLQPEDQVLEIGTGFGGFSIHAATKYDCHVTTTTISRQQYEEAHQRIHASSVADRIKLLQSDYRQLLGQFDRLVSIEMIEAVGHRYLDRFFRKCSSLLKEDGSMLLQVIVMPEKTHGRYLKSVDFLQRYLFPGGCLPSLASMLESVGRASDFRFVHAEDLAPHYAETLRRWRASFKSQLPQIRQLGYSEKLIRLWNYYLCYCEAAFEERYIGLLQIQFDKPKCRRDPIEITEQAARTIASERGPKPRRSNQNLKPQYGELVNGSGRIRD